MCTVVGVQVHPAVMSFLLQRFEPLTCAEGQSSGDGDASGAAEAETLTSTQA